MDIAREICTDSFYTVNGGLPRVPLTAVRRDLLLEKSNKTRINLRNVILEGFVRESVILI